MFYCLESLPPWSLLGMVLVLRIFALLEFAGYGKCQQYIYIYTRPSVSCIIPKKKKKKRVQDLSTEEKDSLDT